MYKRQVGDSFCGGGSIPFEAARIGCEAYGSDLNPVAALLTWAGLNLLGAENDIKRQVVKLQQKIFEATDRQVTEWGIEHSSNGERAEVFLYCVEVKPEGCSYYIPLAPSWVISEKYRIVATWHHVDGSDKLRPEIIEVSSDELIEYKRKKGATVIDGRVIDPFNPDRTWSVESLRGSNGLRRWTNDDLVPRKDDVFQERMYCIRWIDAEGLRRYAAPNEFDLANEAKALALLQERFVIWQREGFIPSKPIPVNGDKTDEPIRTRGWTHWHHLFLPRQLLLLGKFWELISADSSPYAKAVGCLSIWRATDRMSRLCHIDPHISKGPGSTGNVFMNQALNTQYSFGCRTLFGVKEFFITDFSKSHINFPSSPIQTEDARDIKNKCDIWITDPPYADAVNYHELSDFFLAWGEKQIGKAFPGWIPDARAELAVRGDGDDFRQSMVEIYKNLSQNMPDNGIQMVMFTHQDPSVWADLGMILWAAGLKSTAAWTISTETEGAGICLLYTSRCV